MAILAGDIKLVKSEVMGDVPEGGGAPTATVIADGDSNAIFDDVSEVARAGGQVSLRKVFATVQTDNVDTYLGSNVIIAQPPEDPLLSVTLFSTGETFDRRTDAQSRLEAYLAPGSEWAGYLLENHIEGQSSIRLFQRPGSDTPPIGRTLILVYHEGLSDERLQYVRVTDVSVEQQQFTYFNGTNPEDYTAQVVTCDLSDALGADFPGSPPARGFARVSDKTKLRDTVVANAANYYGVVPLTEAAGIGDLTCQVSSIFTQLVPSAQTEIPLIDQGAAGQSATLVVSASGTASYTTTAAFGAGTVLSLGNSAMPGTVVITHSAGELTDAGGQLYSGAEVIGLVDYALGTVTFASGAPTFGGSKTVAFMPAGAPLSLADTTITQVTAESRAYNYIKTIIPAPAPGTMQVSYMSNGRWYTLRDNGSGTMRGSDAAFGAGTVSYTTGTVAATVGALPDVGSAILYSWGATQNFIDRSGVAVAAPKIRHTAAHGGLAPGYVVMSWDDGVSTYGLDDTGGAGVLSGDGTGTVNCHTGDIEFTPTTLPAGGQEYALDYSYGPALSEPFAGAARELDNTVTLTLAEGDVMHNSVVLTWPIKYTLTTEDSGTVYIADKFVTRTARDDGAGNIKLGAVTIGTINYTTRVINFQPDGDFQVAVPQYNYQASYVTDAGGLAYERRVLTGYTYTASPGVLQPTATVTVGYRATGSGTTTSETFTGGTVNLDLTPTFAETVVPGSVLFELGGRRYFDRVGAIYHSLNLTTGAATLAGAINYATGEVALTSWATGGGTAVTLLSLLTRMDGTEVPDVSFRVPVAPLRPGSLQLLATKLGGGTINVTADGDGNITAAGVAGTVDYQTGVVTARFGALVTAAGNEAAPWYDAALVSGGQIWRPAPVFAETIRYNAVAYTYLPLDPEILGLNPVRLPQDGRVPIFRRGGFAVVGHTDTTEPQTVANDDVIDCGRVRLSRVRVLGADDQPITTGYTQDLEAGTVTFTNVTGYAQPVRVEHRIEDMVQVSDVQISGALAFTRPLTHVFPEGAYVSSALVTGNLKARVSLVFDQATWDGTSWADTLSGSAATGTYNTVAAPIVVTNKGAVTERWALRFTSTSAFQIIGEHVGVIGTGSINTETAPINPATGSPYFTIPDAGGWGIGWAVGNIVRLNTVDANVPIWLVRTVQQGPETVDQHSFTLLTRGDVDAP